MQSFPPANHNVNPRKSLWQRLFAANRNNDMAPTVDKLREILMGIKAPGNQQIFTPEAISHIGIENNRVVLIAELAGAFLSHRQSIEPAIQSAIRKYYPNCELQIILTATRIAENKSEKSARINPYADKGELWGIRDVKKIIAVASGKGGVGKSTTAVNLAVALSQMGKKTGLLDCDIYGPSVPRMMGIDARPEITADKKMRPLTAHGVSLMSMGFLVPAEAANIWRGPMVMGAVTQMLGDVDWGPLDYLIVDMPPGTGDAQLTLCQRAPLAGAVIVSTPQDIALIDARKAVTMFQKVGVPILGIIENMSYFDCPNCHHRSDIFAHGGARLEAEKLDVPFLGEIPLELKIRENMDLGNPMPNIYNKIAGQIT